MSDRLVLINRRRFPRARLSCDVTYGDRFQSCNSHTRDISLGGCRVAGYYPFPLGKSLALKMMHPSMREPGSMIGNVARLHGGAENAIALVFDKKWRGASKFEDWICRVIAKDPNAERTISQTLTHLPIEAQLRRAPRPQIERLLSPGETALMQRLGQSTGPVSLADLRTEWGDEWERKAQVAFDLIADGIIQCSMQPQRTTSSTIEKFVAENFFKKSTKLMKALESQYGPIDKTFARELEAITREVIGTEQSVDQPPPKEESSAASPVLKKSEVDKEARRPIVPPFVSDRKKIG